MIERAIMHVERLFGRKLTGEEILLLGVVYQAGFTDGVRFEKSGGQYETTEKGDSEETEEN